MYTYIYVYIYVYIFMCVYIYICIYILICLCWYCHLQANAKLKKQLEALQKASSASTATPSSQKRPRTPPSSAAASKKPTFRPNLRTKMDLRTLTSLGPLGMNLLMSLGVKMKWLVKERKVRMTRVGRAPRKVRESWVKVLHVCHVICLHTIYMAVFKCFWGTLRNINLPSKFWSSDLFLTVLVLRCRQDEFVNAIIRIKEKTSKFTRHKRRGWYTKEKMKVKLGWSKCLVRICVSHPYKT